jgi:hypothetical protein
MTLQLIETKTLSSAAASIEFISIPQTFTDLVLVFSARSSVTGSNFINLYTQINGLSSGYSERGLFGDGSAASSNSGSQPEFRFLAYVNASGATSNTFSNGQIYMPNYTGSTAKSFSSDGVIENNATASLLNITAGLNTTTSPITSIYMYPQSGNLVAGSTFSLYGILKGSDGIVTTS